MRIVLHLSDLHFGRADPVIVHPLLDFIRGIKPDLVAVSGDLTQRAHTEQFLEARNFLDAIPFPKIVVPGNHDVPLYNVFARLFRMLDKFRRFISDMLLAGHFHVAGTTRTATRYKIDNFSALIVASGTSISTRGRGQPNSLNVIQIETSTITITQYRWRRHDRTFDPFSTERFVRTDSGWTRT
jgi:3',5'-cyclic AMP phosphodiesterase CpdA